jgi:ABC-type nitrate/sulfonate/bicarbonate transport system substrate-binding protein
MNQLGLRGLAVVAAVTIFGSSCGATSSPAASATTGAPAVCAAKKAKIAIPVTPPNVVHLPPYVAKELGYFTAENLDVELVKFEGGVGAFRALAGGSVDLAGTSSEPMITAIEQGADVKAVYTYAPNVDVSFVVGPSITTAADLKGKKIGIQEPGGFTDVMSRVVLKKAKIDPKDVQFVTTSTAARVSKLLDGTVDTGVLHIDQTLGIQKRAPGIKVLYNMWEILTDYEYAVYAASNTLPRDTLECLLRALIKADRAMYDPALRSRLIDIAVKYTKAEKDVVEKTYDQLSAAKAWPQNEGIPKKNIDGTVKILLENKQITKTLTFEQIVDLSVAKKVVQQLGKIKDFPY